MSNITLSGTCELYGRKGLHMPECKAVEKHIKQRRLNGEKRLASGYCETIAYNDEGKKHTYRYRVVGQINFVNKTEYIIDRCNGNINHESKVASKKSNQTNEEKKPPRKDLILIIKRRTRGMGGISYIKIKPLDIKFDFKPITIKDIPFGFGGPLPKPQKINQITVPVQTFLSLADISSYHLSGT
ncbi:MAG: hypothetical protein FD145_495 [Candidatus Saganbacteria bacterium]|uniref:Uncharacterized protein n=1 Tax=Candidatus Saganbacteria bacterium TaxID=2575572 RepID=A0A833L1P9_UNCSA|nr:MAG: hypothetical protein FD145_495 [Candidatus Saganbacteria bacterium]